MKVVINESQYNKLFNKTKTKLVIDESQYNRLFNKTKTKLVITESQFNSLMSEANVEKSLKNVKTGDLLQIAKENGNVYHFKVVDSVMGGSIYMVSTDNGTLKGFYILINGATSFQNKELQYQFKKIDEIEDESKIYKESPSWKFSTIKGISKFEVFNSNQSPKFDIDIKTGEPKKPEEKKEKFKGNESTPEKEELIKQLTDMEEDKDYIFNLKNGNQLTFMVQTVELKNIGMELMSADGDYSFDVGKTFNLEAKNENIVFRGEGDYDIQLTMFLGGEEEGGKTESKSKKVEIKGIYDIQDKGVSDEEKEEEDTFDYESLKDRMENDPILKDIIQTRPSAALELIKVSRKRGSIPASDRLAKWGLAINNGSIEYQGKKFIASKLLSIKFIGSGKIKDTKNQEILDDFNSKLISKNSKLGVKVAPFRQGDKYTTLNGGIDGFLYKLEVQNEVDGKEDTYLVNVKLTDKETKKTFILASYEIKVENYNA